MDYDESAIARIYDEARALTPERLRQWRDVLAMDIDCSRISAIVDLGCGTGRFTQLLATHFQAEVIGIDPSPRTIEDRSVDLVPVAGAGSSRCSPIDVGWTRTGPPRLTIPRVGFVTLPTCHQRHCLSGRQNQSRAEL